MPIEICGMLLPVLANSAATPSRIGGRSSAGGRARGVDLEAVDLFARAHEEAGFDTALIGSSSAAPDGFQIAQRSATVTERLNMLVSHRTGFIAPTMAARLIRMGIARATTAPGNSTALVGTPEQVAESILRYYDVGIDALLIRGFDAYADTTLYGKELIPAIRERVAARDAERA